MRGRAFVFGDGIDTDALAPGIFMKLPIAELARHCLESVDSTFVQNVKPGDILVGGLNFGVGSSREQAAEALKELGIACVIARSFGNIFYRNALNFGLPVLVCPTWSGIQNGDVLDVDPRSGLIENLAQKTGFSAQPLPDFLLEMIDNGGLVPHLEKRFARERQNMTGKTEP